MDNAAPKPKYVLEVSDKISVGLDLKKLIPGWIICSVFELWALDSNDTCRPDSQDLKDAPQIFRVKYLIMLTDSWSILIKHSSSFK